MLARDIRDLSESEITTRIKELEEERFRLRFRSATETLEDPLQLRVIRKDIARLQTVLREKRGAEAGPQTKQAGGARRNG